MTYLIRFREGGEISIIVTPEYVRKTIDIFENEIIELVWKEPLALSLRNSKLYIYIYILY